MLEVDWTGDNFCEILVFLRQFLGKFRRPGNNKYVFNKARLLFKNYQSFDEYLIFEFCLIGNKGKDTVSY